MREGRAWVHYNVIDGPGWGGSPQSDHVSGMVIAGQSRGHCKVINGPVIHNAMDGPGEDSAL